MTQKVKCYAETSSDFTPSQLLGVICLYWEPEMSDVLKLLNETMTFVFKLKICFRNPRHPLVESSAISGSRSYGGRGHVKMLDQRNV